MEAFENIFLDLSKHPGKCRFSEQGFGWKPSKGEGTHTFEKDDIQQASWSRAARGYELRVLTRKDWNLHQFDGFDEGDQERLSRLFKLWYGTSLEHKEHAIRGWNWGKSEFGKAELMFNVQNRPAFEIPYTEVSNTNLAGRNEVSIELSAPAEADGADTNGDGSGGRKKHRKLGAARDQLVEARFYIPGTISRKEKKGGEDGELDDASGADEEVEEQNAANTWYETLMDKAEIGEVAGDTIASFSEILHLTPRGRFDLDMYEKSFRLRGKTYDYKIQYESIKKFFILPKTDEAHMLITIGLDPPIRQGQTRYPFLVMQFSKEDDIELELNVTEEDLKEKYKDKLQAQYSGPSHLVLTHLFRGLGGKKIISPSKEFSSRHGQSAVKCSVKASEGFLYCMDKSFMFVPKPAQYIQMDNIQMITMSRVGGAVSASRTFDITMTMKGGQGEHQFSNINREEQQPLEDFFKAKGIKVRNEMAEDAGLLSSVMNEQDLDSSEDEVVQAGRGSADEDSEEEDDDFQAGSDSDVAEEFDENHQSSGSDSDAEMGDADGDADEMDEDGDEEPEAASKSKSKPKAKSLPEHPRKKQRTSK